MAVNVIIPIKDTPVEYFEQCLYSLATQTKKSFITTVVDDASTEKNYHQYLKIINKMPFEVMILRNDKNLGPGPARQRGMDAAIPPAEYFMFLDSDDMLYPRAIDIMLQEAKINESDILSADILAKSFINSEDGLVPRDVIVAWSTCKLFKRKFLEEHNIRFLDDLFSAEDSYFGLVAYNHTKKTHHINETMYYWRHNKESITRSEKYNFLDINNLDHFKSQYYAIKKILRYNPTWNCGGAIAYLYNNYQYAKAKEKEEEIEKMNILLKDLFSYEHIQNSLTNKDFLEALKSSLKQSKLNTFFTQTYLCWVNEIKKI